MNGPRHSRVGPFARWIVAAILLMPVIWAIWASFQPIDRIFAAPDSLEMTGGFGRGNPVEKGPQWRNYELAATRLPIARFMLNGIMIAGAATIGTVLSCSLAGFAFARLRWRGRGLCFVLMLATLMVPAQVLLIPQFLVFEQLGWVNTYKPLIVPAWLASSAFYVFLFRQFFRAVPQSYEDAARIDGATDWQLYRHVMLPMSKPVIGAVAALAAVHHWQEFLSPLVYLSDFNTYPPSVGLRMYQMLEGSSANLVMAAAVMTMVPPLVVVLLTQRYLMRQIGQ